MSAKPELWHCTDSQAMDVWLGEVTEELELFVSKDDYDAVLQQLQKVADVAHSGGLCDLTDSGALSVIRGLTVEHFGRAGGYARTKERVQAAIAEAKL